MSDETILVRVQEARLKRGEVDEFLRDERAGAACVFAGTTRRWTGERETTLLDYEAFDEMATSTMHELARTAQQRWNVLRVALLHRTGRVPIGQSSVLIGVCSPHRHDAFEACRWLIDTLKDEVPIWKREVLRDGTKEWVENDRPPDVV